MKKSLCLLMIGLVLLSGCGKKEAKSNNDVTNPVNVSDVDNQEENTTNEEVNDKKEDESTTTKKTTTKTTTKKTTTKTTTKATTKAKNVYTSVRTGKDHKYTYVYSDKDTCNKKGDEHFDVVNPTHPYVAFGCDEIKDSNGNTLWGVYFYKEASESSIFYY